MGNFVICAFRPRPGKDADLLEVLRTHMPTLRSQDLITDRPASLMRAEDGTILEVFEWKSAEHTRQAHENPVVREMWNRFEACCDYVSLRDVADVLNPAGTSPPAG